LHLGNGKWLAAARKAGLTLLYSEDDAKTWRPYGPLPRGKVTSNMMHPGHLTRLKDGTILLSYGKRQRQPKSATPPGVEVMFSNDDGKTWSEPYRLLNVDSADSGYPSSVQRKDGQVVTAYYARGIPGHKGYHMGVVIWEPDKNLKP
ncbi:sialidase family protein, partial [Verrucomicrobiota bacterium]